MKRSHNIDIKEVNMKFECVQDHECNEIKRSHTEEEQTRSKRFFMRFRFVPLVRSFLCSTRFEQMMLLKDSDTVSRLSFYYLDILLFTVLVYLFVSFFSIILLFLVHHRTATTNRSNEL